MRRRCHRNDAQVGVLHGAQLPLQENRTVGLTGFVEKGYRISHIGADDFPQLQQLRKEGLHVYRWFVIHRLEQNVLNGHRML